METPTTHGESDEPASPIDESSVPTGGGEALNLTVSSTSRGERSDSIPTGGGEMLIDLSPAVPDRPDESVGA